MKRLHELGRRLCMLFRRGRFDADLEEEMRLHRELREQEKMAEGATAEEAHYAMLRRFGNPLALRERSRFAWGWNWLETLLQDIRFGLRQLRRNPGFTIVAVLTLALGIGANTAIFSVVEAVLLRSLPVPNLQELLQVDITVDGRKSDSFSYPIIRALSERKDVFANLGGFCGNTFNVRLRGMTVRTPGEWVSGGFFPALELKPAAGRLLSPADDQPGAPLVAVISDGYWERNFHRDPRAVGTTLTVEGHPVTIVGVEPRGFTGADVGMVADLTMVFQAKRQLDPYDTGLIEAGNYFIRVLARPAQGLTADQVRARLRVIWPPMAAVSVTPKMPPKRRRAMLASSLDVEPGGTGWTRLRNQYAKPLYVLMALSGLVLLVACANVANLLLARSTASRHEIAVRRAVGAGRGRVVRQLLSEGLLLALMGAAAGLLVARAGSVLLLRLASSGSHPILLSVGLDRQVLIFMMGVTILTGLLFALAAALRAGSIAPALALKGGGQSSPKKGVGLAPMLVTAQVAWSLLLLIGAGLFIRTLQNLQTIDPGFQDEGVLLLDVNARRTIHAMGPQGDEAVYAVYREGLNEISELNGVKAVGLSNYTPISGGYWSRDILLDGRPQSGESPIFFAVSPGFFETLRIPFVAGRDFNLRDDVGAPPVGIVNQEFLRRYMPNEPPLGHRVSVADSPFWRNMQIVGVTANFVPYLLRQPIRPCVFVPFFQQPPGRVAFGTFEIHARGSLSAVSAAVEGVAHRLLPGSALVTRSLTSQVEDSIRTEILMAKLAGFFGGLALLLAALGVYGLLAYTVTARTGEIAVRMALGAQKTDVLRMVVGHGLRLILIGVVMGIAGALALTRFLSSMLYGVKPTDPLIFASVSLILIGVALVACYIPARRAARVDPMVALRYE
jgi:putative ABC transport system permease protein